MLSLIGHDGYYEPQDCCGDFRRFRQRRTSLKQLQDE